MRDSLQDMKIIVTCRLVNVISFPFSLSDHSQKLACLRVVCCYFWKTFRNLLQERYRGLACSEKLTKHNLENPTAGGGDFLLIIAPSQEKFIVSLSKSFTDVFVLFRKLRGRKYKHFLYVSALIIHVSEKLSVLTWVSWINVKKFMTKCEGIVTNCDSSFYYKGVYLYVEGGG